MQETKPLISHGQRSVYVFTVTPNCTGMKTDHMHCCLVAVVVVVVILVVMRARQWGGQVLISQAVTLLLPSEEHPKNRGLIIIWN